MFNKGRYNSYRKRSFSLSDTKRKEYAQNMNEIKEYFADNPSWSISYHLDSAYRYYERFQLRLSNHSANNMYHDLIVNVSDTIRLKKYVIVVYLN